MIVFQVLKVGPHPNRRIFLRKFHQSKNQEQKKLSRSASEAIPVRRKIKKMQEACQVVIQKASQVVPSSMGTTEKKAEAVIHHPSFKAQKFFQPFILNPFTPIDFTQVSGFLRLV
jgi:hypothetical protein